ncbi:transposase [Ochrobactrum pecoris]|uniref:Transposase n=1 Tax=Brucella pecoris TaxID=867683 RepID=A0A5C5CBK3_9HYPH|nr:transposase [Brucella pecoris]TNV08637.1 transposase [Brucella pecoris]
MVNSVGVDGATVTEVALRHDVSRQQIYMWRSELKRKGLLLPSPEPLFLPVDMTAAPLGSEPNSSVDASSSMVELQLRCGRRLCFDSQMEGAVLTRLIRAVERERDEHPTFSFVNDAAR